MIKNSNNISELLDGNNLPISFVYLSQLHEWKRESINSKDDDFERLLKDIKENGIKEPIIISYQESGEVPKFKVVDGEHRCIAADMLNIKIIPCRIV